MSDQAHSPAPFALIKSTREHGHLILDALGDSIGALARATGDHEPEEQLANAQLFTASPILLALAIRAARFIDGFQGHPDLDREGGVTALLTDLRTAIIQAEGGE